MRKQSAFVRALTTITIASALVYGCVGSTVRAAAPNPNPCAGLGGADQASAEQAIDQARLVRTLQSERQRLKFVIRRLAGVELYVAAQPGLTEPWLQRVAECRVVQRANAADPRDPFAVPGAQVDVETTRAGYLVRVTTGDRDQALELVRRAEQTYAKR